jgi:hypothetical protein
MSPAALSRVVKRCLAKDPDDRWQTARDLMHELEWIAQGGGSPASLASNVAPAPMSASASSPAPTAVSPVAPRRRTHPAWIVAGLAGVVLVSALALLPRGKETPRSAVVFSVTQIPGTTRFDWPALSPDGRTLAFRATDSTGVRRVWLRPLGSLVAHSVPGTENSGRPFWSPDSRFLAFFSGQQLKKVPASGGPTQLICEVRGGSDGSWGSNDTIVFDGGWGDSIRQVSASGGTVSGATTIDRERHTMHAWPYFLPDGEHFLFYAQGKVDVHSRLCVGRLGSSEIKELIPTLDRGVYVPPGYILYADDNTLMARAFDPKRLELKGDPFPAAAEIEGTSFNTAHFSGSNAGSIAYTVSGSGRKCALVWFDRTGKRLEQIGADGFYRDFQISLDGSRVRICSA